jgi:ribosomal protein L21
LVEGDVELLSVEFEEASVKRTSLAVVGRGDGQEAIITAKMDVVAEVGETFRERKINIQTKRKKQNKIN